MARGSFNTGGIQNDGLANAGTSETKRVGCIVANPLGKKQIRTNMVQTWLQAYFTSFQ
jgi:hypothetical protein